jgi:hypothetical protein
MFSRSHKRLPFKKAKCEEDTHMSVLHYLGQQRLPWYHMLTQMDLGYILFVPVL